MTRLLIADDNAEVRKTLRSFLDGLSGVEVCGESQSGYETIETALKLKPDLIVLDVVMPKLNGIETASILKKVLPNTKIVLFTMYDDYVKTLATTVGVDMVVSKPDGIAPLVGAVKAVLLDRSGETQLGTN
jgi:DNA-binding NarL/FixJ family response regulator